MSGAAFFDLDRTLLAGASGEVFSDALREAGLVTRSIPGEKTVYSLFNLIGETLPAMALARQGATVAKGRSRTDMQVAAEGAADRLVSMVQPFAHAVFEMHRQEGRPIVLATTTPYDLVKPFADRLGLDDVIATRYAVGDDGDTFTGALDGHFTWATGKLAAARKWATANDVRMRDSYAYSDSVYDSFLLGAVGHPVVVNPDPRMVVLAAARRWPTLNLDVSPGVAKVPLVGMELQKIAMTFARPAMVPFADIEISGTEQIPAEGPVILVANHRSYFDASVISMVVAKTGRPVRFLGKKEVFDAPLLGQFASAMGGIRVDRASGSNQPLDKAIEALNGGEMVAIMPEGTIPRGPAFFDPELKGRWGAARLAAVTKAPVIPVGLWGTEKVWPRSARLPDMFNVVDAPSVRAKVGKPVELKYRSLAKDTERIMSAISKQLPKVAREPYEPTPEEVARTYPPGYRGHPAAEAGRRPGTDT